MTQHTEQPREPDARERVQQLFIRVCRDSGFQLSAITAAKLVAKVIGIHPLEVWIAMPDLEVMERIAAGDHPAAHRPAPHDDTRAQFERECG